MKKSISLCALLLVSCAWTSHAAELCLVATKTPQDLGGVTLTTPRILGGEGVFTHAVFDRPTLAPTRTAEQEIVAVPKFGEGIVFSNAVTVCLGALRRPAGTKLTVATYEGTAPDLSIWSVDKKSLVSGSFAASEGQIVLTVAERPTITLKVH